MAATVKIFRYTGSGPTGSDITGINTRANAEDTHTEGGTNNPIRIPTGVNRNYSYWVNTRLEATGSWTQIDQIKWYTDESQWNAAVSGIVTVCSGYTQATGTPGTTGTELTQANYVKLIIPNPPDNMFNKISSSPLSVSGIITPSSPWSAFVIYQVVVGSQAPPGTTGQEPITWQYDEV